MDGVMFNKDVTHSKMRRKIENPRVLLLDCPLEYKKGEVRYDTREGESERKRERGRPLPPVLCLLHCNCVQL